MDNNNYNNKIIQKLLELCKYIKWQNVESFDDINKIRKKDKK